MTFLRNTMRYELLVDQFKLNENQRVPQEVEQSIERFFKYIFEQTDLYYLDYMDEDVLNGYIIYHSKDDFRTVSFSQCLKDVKAFLYFLEHIKGIKSLPTIDLSLKNLALWGNF